MAHAFKEREREVQARTTGEAAANMASSIDAAINVPLKLQGKWVLAAAGDVLYVFKVFEGI